MDFLFLSANGTLSFLMFRMLRENKYCFIEVSPDKITKINKNKRFTQEKFTCFHKMSLKSVRVPTTPQSDCGGGGKEFDTYGNP